MPKNDPLYVNVKKKYKEKAASVIEKIKQQQAETEAKLKKVNDERRAKQKGSAPTVTVRDLLSGNVSDNFVAEAKRPEKQLERKKFLK